MARIDLFVTGFGRPDLLREQHRLLLKFMGDEFTLTVVDNTIDEAVASQMREETQHLGLQYVRVEEEEHYHHQALNLIAEIAHLEKSPYWGCLDHDVFPRAPVTLIDKIKHAGFYGIGQTHRPTGHRYLFPGFCFFSREWVDGAHMNFDGIRAANKRDDGDCGSMLHSLFSDDDWLCQYRGEHGYGHLRDEDSVGLQSWGYEVFDGDWIHFTNASHWKQVPDPDERDRLIRDMLAAL